MTASCDRPLEIQIDRRDGFVVVRVRGSVSIGEADRLREALEAVAGEPVPLIVLDVREMDFISSLGLGAIISAYLKARYHQGRICLVEPTPQVRHLLETTRLTRLFAIADSVESALAGAGDPQLDA